MSIPIILVLLMGAWSVFRAMTRWRIHLYGKNSSTKSGSYQYVFALQNGEDVPLPDPFRLEIELEGEGAIFEPTNLPRVFAGPPHKLTKLELSEDARMLCIEANMLAPLDTWVIQFESSATPKNVAFRFGPPRPRDSSKIQRRIWPHYLKRVSLRQRPLEETMLPDQTPPWRLFWSAFAVVAALYLLPVILSGPSWLPLAQYFSPFSGVDGILLLVMLAGSLLVFRLCRLQPHPVIQGYLEPRTPSLRASGSTEAAVPERGPSGKRS